LKTKIKFQDDAWSDYLYWQQQDKRILDRINSLINEISRTPYAGTGKPEPLKYELTGYWSRRINDQHRLIYKVVGDTIIIIQCRYHY
jgi:toxin-antitoxin system, toxin component, Txe/YoeB family